MPARAPHWLLCVLSSGGGGGGSGGRGGEQGVIPAPVAPALWPPPPPQLRCPGCFGQGQRAVFLTFVEGGGGAGSRPRAGRGRGLCEETRRWGLWVGWRVKGSGQVLEDVGGRGWGRGCGGRLEGVGRFG